MAQLHDVIPKKRDVSWPAGATPDSLGQPDGWRATTSRGALRTGLRHGERKLFQAVVDLLIVLGGSLAILTFSERGYARSSVFVSLAIVAGLWLFFADAFDAYNVLVLETRFRNAYNVGAVLLATGVTYTLFAWLVGGFTPVIRPRISETFLAILLILPLVGVRLLSNVAMNSTPLRRRVAVVGANTSGLAMVEALREYGGATYEFLGYFEDHSSAPSDDAVAPFSETVLPIADLQVLHETVGLDQILLANPVQTPALLRMLSICHERGIQVTPMFALYQDLTGRVPVSYLGKDWFVALPAHVKPTTRAYMGLKRTLDVTLAAAMLLVVLPLIPLVALLIKLDSPGPIFFRQVRVGAGGRLFSIVKFRSMRQDAEAAGGAVWASNRDPRITRVGRFLRKSRIDELPQLWNVLVGDMSFVGPRPERPEFDEQLEREIPFYRARRAVRPGLTGWAQVRHGYGNTLVDAHRKVEYDLYYIKNESLYLDVLILLRTVAVVLKLAGT